MATTYDAEQGRESRKALDAYLEAQMRTSERRIILRNLNRQVREARKLLREAEAAERVADAAYIATPFQS
jgi:hypothetical protein